jgi:hypothetical protein
VPADEVGDDAVEPRARLRPRQVVTAALLEGDHEGLGHQVVGRFDAEPSGRVPVDVVGVAGVGILIRPGGGAVGSDAR